MMISPSGSQTGASPKLAESTAIANKSSNENINSSQTWSAKTSQDAVNQANQLNSSDFTAGSHHLKSRDINVHAHDRDVDRDLSSATLKHDNTHSPPTTSFKKSPAQKIQTKGQKEREAINGIIGKTGKPPR